MRPPDTDAATVLHTIGSGLAASGGALFEPAAGDYFPTVLQGTFEGGPEVSLPADGLLIRWLRVNALQLVIPDRIGLWSALTPAEQSSLSTLGINLAVPLVCDGELVAWAGLKLDRAPESVPVDLERAQQLARDLRAARAAAAERRALDDRRRAHGLTLAGQMAAGVAHEVRNPLAAVRSMVQLIHAGTPPPHVRTRMLGTVLQEIDRVNQALTSILTLGRPVSTRDTPIDLATVTRQAADFCAAYARQHGHTIVVELEHRLPVLGDAHELRQAVINVLLNACQACQAGQQIRVEGRANNGRGVVRVVDSGPGIPPDVLKRVYEPFFTTKNDGGGLGLALCQAAIRRHGGELSIASALGRGTIVTFDLPLIEEHGSPARH